MTRTPHDLAVYFPSEIDVLHQLKVENAHFKQLAAAHRHLNREVHWIDEGIDVASDVCVEEVKKRRLGLLDEEQMIATATRELRL